MPAFDGSAPAKPAPADAGGAGASARPWAASLRLRPRALLTPLLLALLMLGGCSSYGHLTFLDPKGPISAAERTHFYVVNLILTIVVLPVLVLTPIFAWRYRYRNASARYTPRWEFWWPLEIEIWAVPLGIVIMLAIWLTHDTVGLDPYVPVSSQVPASSDPPLRVEVVGYDWKWLFVYPDEGIASIGELAVPAGRELAFDLTSDTVLQSFVVPALGSQIYAMPGMVTHLHLVAKAPGSFLGENTQYNGEGFEKQKSSQGRWRRPTSTPGPGSSRRRASG
jgi:cytochrome o ubiquinol oxidase subunit 2